jgi:hypothetical protein
VSLGRAFYSGVVVSFLHRGRIQEKVTTPRE